MPADFSQLVKAVSAVDPEMRLRFTSPHPKDFPPHLLQLIAARANICTASAFARPIHVSSNSLPSNHWDLPYTP